MAENTKKVGLRVHGIPGNTDYGYGSLITGEYLSKLTGQQGIAIYDEMRRSDPQVQAVLKAITLPIRKARYYVEPATDKLRDKKIAEIIGLNLFEQMTMTWDDTLRHALLMLPFGFSILEKIWYVQDNLFKIKKLDPRLPVSVIRWEYDEEKKKLQGPVQQDTDGKEYFLPIEKIMVYTSEKEGDNWEGISILRSAYKPWFLKSKLEKINAIKHDRWGVGIPKITLPAGVKEGSQEYEDAKALGMGLYAHEKMFILEPDGYTVNIITPEGGSKGGTDILPSISYYDEAIAKAVLAMFINLGTSQTGSRALGGSFIEVFMDSLQAYANYICEVITRFLIREYCDYNWYVNGDYPVLKVGKIKNLDTHTIAELVKVGVITPDESVEVSVREELNLPEKEEEEESGEDDSQEGAAKQENEEGMEEIDEEENTPGDGSSGKKNLSGGPSQGKAGAGEGPSGMVYDLGNINPTAIRGLSGDVLGKLKDAIVQVEAGRAREKTQRIKARFREENLSPEEMIPDLVAIEMRLNESARNIKAEVLNIREIQGKDIIMQIVAGRKRNKIRVVQKAEMYNVLMKEYKVQMKAGRAEVREELAEQKARAGGGQLADGIPEDTEEFLAYEDKKLQGEIEGAAGKLSAELWALWLIYDRQGITGQALESAMLSTWEERISTKTWDNMADGVVNGGWGAGRTIEGNKHKNEIEYAYYSSVLDRSTCRWCEVNDGNKHEVGDPNFITPNPECAGTENLCRCITVYVLKAEAADAE